MKIRSSSKLSTSQKKQAKKNLQQNQNQPPASIRPHVMTDLANCNMCNGEIARLVLQGPVMAPWFDLQPQFCFSLASTSFLERHWKHLQREREQKPPGLQTESLETAAGIGAFMELDNLQGFSHPKG